MRKKQTRNIIFALVALALIYSFKDRESWTELCAGLAFFLFGMQCMNDGLQQLAGSKLEQILAKSTATPTKGFLFGVLSTVILQSTTVVALLTIAFISTGLITLIGGITIILGANLGASSGVWLLALAGQNISLGTFAYPMIVVGVLASFNGNKSKALGRVLLGIAFILLAIDLIKTGFSGFSSDIDFAAYNIPGFLGTITFVAIGFSVTVVLQSSHATLMLVLTALGLEQITIEQSFSLAIGAIIGSAVTTGIVGFLGGNRSGMRLALAHVVFNVVTGILTIALLTPLTWFVTKIARDLTLNPLIQLAFFHTLFNLIGVVIFWILQEQLAKALKRWIPDVKEPETLIVETLEERPNEKKEEKTTRSRYLSDSALASTETALSALYQELEHLARMSIEVICLSLHLPIDKLNSEEEIPDREYLALAIKEPSMSANKLYQRYIKGIYSDLLSFMSRIKYDENDDTTQEILMNCQIIAMKLADSVKNSRHLQKNLDYYLTSSDTNTRNFYLQLNRHIFKSLRTLSTAYSNKKQSSSYKEESLLSLESLNTESEIFDKNLRRQIFLSVRNEQIDGFSTSSLTNDINYAKRIVQSLCNIAILAIQNNQNIVNEDDIEEPKNIEPREEDIESFDDVSNHIDNDLNRNKKPD